MVRVASYFLQGIEAVTAEETVERAGDTLWIQVIDRSSGRSLLARTLRLVLKQA
jgi:hypothetical protein